MAEINRLKVVLAEKKKTSKWLTESLGCDHVTVSHLCTNSSQPRIESFSVTAKPLDVQNLLAQ